MSARHATGANAECNDRMRLESSSAPSPRLLVPAALAGSSIVRQWFSPRADTFGWDCSGLMKPDNQHSRDLFDTQRVVLDGQRSLDGANTITPPQLWRQGRLMPRRQSPDQLADLGDQGEYGWG